jgi:hypothetical protein
MECHRELFLANQRFEALLYACTLRPSMKNVRGTDFQPNGQRRSHTAAAVARPLAL